MGGTVYTIAGGKGGVGKTTTAVNLGVVLGQAGQEVVVVDADLAMTNLGQHVGVSHEPGIHQVLAGDAPVRDAVVKGPGGLALIAGDPRLEAFAAADPEELRRVLDLLRIAYDVILVDTGPGIQRETVITYREADGVVLVTTDRPVAVEDANRTAKMAADADCPAVGAVISRTVDRTVPASADDLEMDILGVVPEHASGGPVTATEPDGEVASAYREIATELPAVDASDVIPYGPAREDEPADEEAAETSDDAAAETAEATEQSADATADVSEQAVETTSDETSSTPAAVRDDQTNDESVDDTDRDADGSVHDRTDREQDVDSETAPVDPGRGAEEIGSTDPVSPPVYSVETVSKPVQREGAEDTVTPQ